MLPSLWRKSETVQANLPTDIPRDAQLFYEDFGFLDHPYIRDPKTHRPIPVTKLAPYQIEFWNSKQNTLAIKANKMGLTTSGLIEDFQKCLLPETAGGEVMVGAQDQQFANDHITTLKMLIKQSRKYSQFLIERPEQELLREMKSKTTAAWIRNPYDPQKPSKIIALGGSPGRVFSWKKVVHIHLSDISLMIRKDWRTYWRGIVSRVANTRGLIKIESVPAGQQGLVWQLYKLLMTGSKSAETEFEQETFVDDPEELMPSFKPMIFHVREALAAGVITQEYLDQAMRDLGSDGYAAAFECKFLPPGSQWYKPGWFQYENYKAGY